MFAVIRSGGKQYKVTKNSQIAVEKLDAKEGDKITLDDVLFVNDGTKSEIGAKAKVSAKILEQKRNPKITVFKKKRRQNYRRTKGHRQEITVLEITDIKTA